MPFTFNLLLSIIPLSPSICCWASFAFHPQSAAEHHSPFTLNLLLSIIRLSPTICCWASFAFHPQSAAEHHTPFTHNLLLSIIPLSPTICCSIAVLPGPLSFTWFSQHECSVCFHPLPISSFQSVESFLCFSTTDAEIKVPPSRKSRPIKDSLFPIWSRPGCIYISMLHLLPGILPFYFLLSQFIQLHLSQYSPKALTKKVRCVMKSEWNLLTNFISPSYDFCN